MPARVNYQGKFLTGGIMLSREYFNQMYKVMKKVEETCLKSIEEGADLISEAIIGGNTLFAFGCSHSSLPVQDLFYRSGGFMLVNPIFAPGLSLEVFPPTLTSLVERLDGYGSIILEKVKIKPGDVLIIVSISGRNQVPIDMAITAREKGMKTIGLTSLEYSQSVSSRHKSGKKLYELVDIVIDNPVPLGDAVLELDGLAQKFCPISGVTSPAILQALMAATIEKLMHKGFIPPIFLAANAPGGDEHNRLIFEKFKDRVIYL